MNRLATASTAIVVVLIALVSIGCGNDSESGEHSGGADGVEQSGSEHGGGSESGEHSAGSEAGEHSGGSEDGEGGEESGVQFGLDETFDEVRDGTRLILSYDSDDNVFRGTVQNTTDSTLRRVRVEVHLSNGVELGPTTPVDIEPRRTVTVFLTTTGDPFTSWSAHAEVD